MKILVLHSFYIAPEIFWKLPNSLENLVCYNEEGNFGILKKVKKVVQWRPIGQDALFKKESGKT